MAEKAAATEKNEKKDDMQVENTAAQDLAISRKAWYRASDASVKAGKKIQATRYDKELASKKLKVCEETEQKANEEFEEASAKVNAAMDDLQEKQKRATVQK